MKHSKEKILEIKPFFEDDQVEDSEGFEVLTNKQKIILAIGAEQCCCEKFGYFWCNDNPQDFIGAELFDITITDKALNEIIMKKNNLILEEYEYSKISKKQTCQFYNDGCFEGEALFINLKTNQGVLQFVAYNMHNGWYGHKIKVSCSQLNIKDYM